MCVCGVSSACVLKYITFWSFEGPPSPDMDGNYGGGLLDMVKGGAGKFFSNIKDNLKDTIKDTSTKVMNQVAT